MPGTDPTSPDSFTIVCIRCERPLIVRRQWIGRDVQCTHCSGVLRVPPAPVDGRPARALTPTLGGKRQFNFG